jgi:TonB family protein
MRKSIFGRAFSSSISLICLLAFASAAGAQNAALPTDPKELMLLAAKTNGLTGADVQPWHLKASYKLLDEKGNITDQGTYEEFWVSLTKFKRIFTGKSFSLTDYGTAKGIFRAGQSEPIHPPSYESLRRELVSPLPSPEWIKHCSVNSQSFGSRDDKLSCVDLGGFNAPLYCLDPRQPIAVVDAYPAEQQQAMHSRILNFRGQFIAGDLKFIHAKKPTMEAHLDVLQTLSPVNDSDFAIPHEAVLVHRGVRIPDGLDIATRKTSPMYPANAKMARVSGSVLLEAVIGADGHVADLKVLSGPQELRQAALDAVRTWVYSPYTINGEPVEVNATVTVIFTLGR